MNKEVKPCPFCGSEPITTFKNNIFGVECPQCVSVGFYNHKSYGCLAETQWNKRIDYYYEAEIEQLQEKSKEEL